LARWRKPLAVHDPAKVVSDVAIALALGGDCLADVALLRAEPGLFGPVASDPTVSRTIDVLAEDAPRVLAAIDSARAAARARVWELAGERAPDATACAATPLVIDVDATLVTAHSDKESAAATFERGFGFHPLWTFIDHGPAGTGEPGAPPCPIWNSRHRRRARCEDRIRCAEDTGPANPPLHDFDQNRIWCAIVALACDITAWMQTLAPSGHTARRWEPKRLRLRLLSIAGRLARTGRQILLHLSAHAPRADPALTALTRLRTGPAPG
jgi:hypothetical protein